MICPACEKPMKKVRWSLTNNARKGAEFKEYDKTTYERVNDDAWVTVELPKVK